MVGQTCHCSGQADDSADTEVHCGRQLWRPVSCHIGSTSIHNVFKHDVPDDVSWSRSSMMWTDVMNRCEGENRKPHKVF